MAQVFILEVDGDVAEVLSSAAFAITEVSRGNADNQKQVVE